MAARTLSAKKPKHLGFTLHELFAYMGRHGVLLLLVAVLVTVSGVTGLLGTYMIRPIVNNLINGDLHTLAVGVLIAAGIFGISILSAYGYTQLMVRMAQKVLFDIRRDLFSHVQKLPLKFFDSTPHGDVMSYFTNDVDTVSDALNNSFAMAIQSFIQMAGTLVILYVLNWRLSLIVTLCYVVMFLYIRYSGRHSKKYYNRQQKSLGALDGYIEETVTGQKVVKVFNHEAENLKAFREKNEALRKAGTGAQSYAATMVPAVVTISYINYAIVAVLGGIMALQGLTDVGSLASYLVFVRQAAAPINQFTQQSNFLLAAMAGAERVFQAMDLEPEVDKGSIRLVRVDENGRETADTHSDRWAWREEDGVLRLYFHGAAAGTKYDLIAVEKGERLINMDAQAPNQVFGEWARAWKWVLDLSLLRPETKYGASRFDFYWEAPGRRGFVEVKGVTLEEDGVVRFPDAPTLRGVKHLEELMAAKEAGYEAAVCFVVQMGEVRWMEPNDRTHPEFGEALRRAARAGVQVLALECTVTPDTLTMGEPVAVKL